MNKAELIDTIAEKMTLSKADAGRTLDAVLETIVSTLKRGDEVAIAGFGIFKVKPRKARTGRNPSTGEKIEIAAANVPGFKPGKAFKDAVAI